MQFTDNCWNGRFKLIVNKKSFRLYKNNNLLLKERFTKEKPCIFDHCKEKLSPDIIKFGKFEIKYYAIYPDLDDIEKIKNYVTNLAKRKDIGATFCFDSETNLPKIHIVGRNNKGVYTKHFDCLEDFEDFINHL